MKLIPHSNDWYDELSIRQKGYYYPWQSTIDTPNGESDFVDILKKHLSGDKVALEVGCGHGDLALEMSKYCKQITAYDRVPSFVDLAQIQQNKKNIHNIKFICFNSKGSERNISLPVEDSSVDIIYSRRGPLHWIEDAKRVLKKGSHCIQLNPGKMQIPSWNHRLPKDLQFSQDVGPLIEENVERRLKLSGLEFSWRKHYNCSEYLPDVHEMYNYLSWGKLSDDIPSYLDVSSCLDGIFQEHSVGRGLELSHNRFIWVCKV